MTTLNREALILTIKEAIHHKIATTRRLAMIAPESEQVIDEEFAVDQVAKAALRALAKALPGCNEYKPAYKHNAEIIKNYRQLKEFARE